MTKPSFPAREVLSPSFSVYLDLVRFVAAMAVFLEHARLSKLVAALPYEANLAGAAVVAFFVLSGYIIAATTDPAEGWRRFAVARAARLYSVVVPAFILSVCLRVGYHIYAAPEPLTDFLAENLAWWQLITMATFTGQVWTLNVPIPWDGPIWSLDYEAFYYLIFGVFLFTAGRMRWILVCLIGLVAGPKILVLMPCWLLGVALARHPNVSFPSRGVAWAVVILAPVAVWSVSASGLQDFVKYKIMWAYVPGFWRLHDAQNFATYYLDALFVAAAFVAARQLDFQPRSLLMRAAPAIQWLAGYTFSLYLFHRPLQHLAEALLGGRPPTRLDSALLLAGILAVIVALGSVTEKRKKIWRRFFMWLFRPSKPPPEAQRPEFAGTA